MASLNPSPSGRWTSESLTDESHQTIKAWLMSLRPDSHVNHSRPQESDSAMTTPETCGPPRWSAFALYDHDSHSLKTCQVSFLPDTSTSSSVTLPKAGMMLDGACYRRQSWERRINVTGFGLWPTPTVMDATLKVVSKKGQKGRHAVQLSHLATSGRIHHDQWWLLPTPRANTDPTKGGGTSRSGDRNAAGGRLNPPWVAWLMGWPLEWTALKPLGTDKFQSWLQQHGDF